MINENAVSKLISEREGKKVQVNIAQIKEVQHHLLEILCEFSNEEILELFDKVRKNRKRILLAENKNERN